MNSIYRLALRIFNCVCTILAGYMTFKQIQIYFENDDTSAISFEKFTDGPTDYYPTYTFCFEDSNRGDMYIDGTRNLVGNEQIRYGNDGLFHSVEENKLVISNEPPEQYLGGPQPPGMYPGMIPDLTSGIQYPPGGSQDMYPEMSNEMHNMDMLPGSHQFIPHEVSAGWDNTDMHNGMYQDTMPETFPEMDITNPAQGMNLNMPPHFLPETWNGFENADPNTEENQNDNVPSVFPVGLQQSLQNNTPPQFHGMDPYHLLNDSNRNLSAQGMYRETPFNEHTSERRKRMFNPMLPDIPEQIFKDPTCKTKNNETVLQYSLARFAERYLIVWNSSGKTYGIKPTHYQELLMGIHRQYKYRPKNVSYFPDCEDIRYSLDDISKIVFDENIIDLKSFLLDYFIKTNDGSFVGWVNDTYAKLETVCGSRMVLGDSDCGAQDSFKSHLKQRKPTPYPFEKVYQDPTKICYSPKINPDLHIESNHITLDLTALWAEKGLRTSAVGAISAAMTVHVHMKGQFMRSIGKEIASINLHDLIIHCPEKMGIFGPACYGTHLSYDISQVTLLKNRHDSDHACNAALKDEDTEIMENILNDDMVKCVPTYWIGLKNYSSRYAKCTSDAQYKRIGEITANFTSHEFVRMKFKHPCEEMIIVTNVQKVKGRERRRNTLIEPTFDPFWIQSDPDPYVEKLYFDIQFRHVNERYQVITNTKGFTVESCWAGIGGFIGIFVGVSLMQLPGIFFGFFTFLSKNPRKDSDNDQRKSKRRTKKKTKKIKVCTQLHFGTKQNDDKQF